MHLSETTKIIITRLLIKGLAVSNFEDVLDLHPKNKIFKVIADKLCKQKSVLKYPSDVYRSIHRHKEELKAFFDSFTTEESSNSEAVFNNNFLTSQYSCLETVTRSAAEQDETMEKLEMEIVKSPVFFEKKTDIVSDESLHSIKQPEQEIVDICSVKQNKIFSCEKDLDNINICWSERHSYLRENLFSLGIYCVVIFKGYHARKKFRNGKLLVEYAVCKHSGCRKFRFEYETKKNIIEKIIVRYDKEEIFHDSEEHAYQLRGEERAETKKKLLHVYPNTLRCKDIQDANTDALRVGNWDKIRSLYVYQKARSEAKAEMDLDKDSYVDLVLRSLREPEDQKSIQMPNGETLVYIYTKRQIEMVSGRGKRVVAHFDSTGSLVRPLKSGSMVYYYALVVNIDGKIVPVAELISSRHDSATLSCFFINMKRYITVSLRKRWPLFGCIVTDWSFALITGICFGFNEMTLYRYLTMVYNFIQNKSRDLNDIIILRCCCAHFIKMVLNRLSKIKIHKHARKLLTEMVSCLMVAETLNSLATLFRALVTVLLHTHQTDEVKVALELFKNQQKCEGDPELLLLADDFDYKDEENEDWEKERGQYLESPFYIYFSRIFHEIADSVPTFPRDNDQINQLKSEEFARYLLNRCMPFVPLWSGLLNSVIGSPTSRYSNSNVECWFKIVKKDVLSNDRRLKIGRFIEKTNERVEVILKTIEFDINTKLKKNRRSTRITDETKALKMQVDKPLKLETWRPKKEKTTYFSLKRLEKYTDNINISLVRGNQQFEKKMNIKPSETMTSSADHLGFLEFEDKYVKQKLAQYMKQITVSENEQLDISEPLKPPGHQSSVTEKSYYFEPEDNASMAQTHEIFTYLENGLFFSPGYYLTGHAAVHNSYVVGFYKYEGHNLKLYSSAYATLAADCNYELVKPLDIRERWLSDDIIDAAAYSIIGHHPDIYYIDAVASKLIFGKHCDSFKAFKPFERSLKGIALIIIPVNVSDRHWFLLALDTKSKIAHILDSGSSEFDTYAFIKDTINYFFNLRKDKDLADELNFDNWQIQKEEFVPKQRDSVNCGVYVLYFLYVLSQTNSLQKSETFLKNNFFDPDRFRITLQQLLLLSSDEMKNLCMNCGSQVMANGLKCYICKRLIHLEQCVKATSISIKNTKCSLCIACSDPFQFVSSRLTIVLDPLVTEHFVQHYRFYLDRLVSTKDTNEECRRFREIPDHSIHLKWDYSTAFFDISSSFDAAKSLKKYLQCEEGFICYVLLGLINRKIFYAYYGLPEALHDMVSHYKELNGLDLLNDEYPSPYTLDTVLERLQDISK